MKQTHVPSLAARCPLADPGRLTLAADPGRPILPPWPGDHGRTRSAIRVALPEIFARRALHTPERADNTSFANSRASNGHRRGQGGRADTGRDRDRDGTSRSTTRTSCPPSTMDGEVGLRRVR